MALTGAKFNPCQSPKTGIGGVSKTVSFPAPDAAGWRYQSSTSRDRRPPGLVKGATPKLESIVQLQQLV